MNGKKAKTLRKEVRRIIAPALAARNELERYACAFSDYVAVSGRRLRVKAFKLGPNRHVLIVRATKRGK